jgi:hypothetical protein
VVFARNGKWEVDYASYANGYLLTRSEAIETATLAARDECRELVVEPSQEEPTRLRAVRRELD